MNYVFVRTKLQALIALRLVEKQVIRSPFRVVRVYQGSTDEDCQAVYDTYAELEVGADRVHSIVEASGLWRSAVKMIKILVHASTSDGLVYLAIVNWYALAIALKLVPFDRLITFDDGSANIVAYNNSYLATVPLRGAGLKRWFARLMFPRGASGYVRTRINTHYTIYRNFGNIVDSGRLRYIDMEWSKYLSEDDISNIPKNVTRILLGTSYVDEGDTKCMQIADTISRTVDLYVRHPRDNTGDGRRFKAPAESIIMHCAERRHITVFHFASSAAYAIPKGCNVTFVNLLAQENGEAGA